MSVPMTLSDLERWDMWVEIFQRDLHYSRTVDPEDQIWKDNMGEGHISRW